MFFSIIIPVYNAEMYLEETVESIMMQKFQDYECLLIDDGSQDESLQLMRKLAKKYSQIKIFSHKNQGPAYTRNIGIENAEGEYLLFVDADDCLKPNILNVLYTELKERRTDVLCYGYEEREKKRTKSYAIDQTLCYRNREEVEKNIINILEKRLLVASTCNKAYARELLLKYDLRLPEQLYLAEDLTFNIKVLEMAESYRFIPNIGYCYIHRNEESLIKKYKKDKYQQLLEAHLEKSKCMRKYGKNEEEVNLRIQMDYVRMCFSCFMDLFLKDCSMMKGEKKQYIKSILEEKRIEQSSVNRKKLSWKERIVYNIFITGNTELLYVSTFFFYNLKFRIGVSL